MIIDLILDRIDGVKYDARDAYNYIQDEESIFFKEFPISRAFDGGSEEDVKRELCRYVKEQGYNPDICNYIKSVNWL